VNNGKEHKTTKTVAFLENPYLSVDGRSKGCSHAQTSCISDVVIMMCTHNAKDRRTKHANGIHIAMPHIRTSVLYELYQHAVQQHTAYHVRGFPVMKGLHLGKYLEDLERIGQFGDVTSWHHCLSSHWWH